MSAHVFNVEDEKDLIARAHDEGDSPFDYIIVGGGSAGCALAARLSALTARAQEDGHLFASPLGPFDLAGRSAWLPRFVFFGPHASDAAWRLAFLSGFDARDLRLSAALVGLVERLTADAADGHGLDLTFFPQIDVAGAAGALAHAVDMIAVAIGQRIARELHHRIGQALALIGLDPGLDRRTGRERGQDQY